MRLDKEQVPIGVELRISIGNYAENIERLTALGVLAEGGHWIVWQDRAVDTAETRPEPYDEGSVIIRKRDDHTGFIIGEGPIVPTPVSREVLDAMEASVFANSADANHLAIIRRIK